MLKTTLARMGNDIYVCCGTSSASRTLTRLKPAPVRASVILEAATVMASRALLARDQVVSGDSNSKYLYKIV